MAAGEVLEQFFRRGLGGQGMFTDFAKGTRAVTDEAAKTLELLQRNGFQKVSYWARHPLALSRQVGESTDTVGRFANFIHNLDRNGLDFEDAASHVRKVLFDYGELTELERKTLKKIFPFYTWTRKVIPAMAERLVSTPGLFTGYQHLRENLIRYHEIDERNTPQWLRDNMALPVGVDAEGNIRYLTVNLPLSELNRVHENPANELLQMANPLLKSFVELGTGKELSGRPISERTGFGKVIDYAKYAGKQIGPVRQLASAYEAQEEEKRIERETAKGNLPEITKPKTGAFEQFLGLTSVQNPAQWARAAQYARREQLTKAITSAESRGVKVPETEELPELGERKGFGAVLSSRGRGFGAVLNPAQLKGVNEPPTIVKQAMDMTGVSPDWGPYLRILMDAESRGNPMAVNQTWVEYSTGRTSNKREGPGWYRATGLFQMMPPTFEQYKVKGHEDIFNPLDNALAAINYIKSKYGHPSKIPGLGQARYGGY